MSVSSNLTIHPMKYNKKFYQNVVQIFGGEINKREDGRIEWICKHGIGHTIDSPKKGKYEYAHHCDGCCAVVHTYLLLNPQKTDIEKYKKALHILGSIWFYGDFKAETPNEKELEKIMIELGYKYKSGTAVFLGNPNPKKKKEKEQYTFILHNEIIKKFRQSYCLSKMGEHSNHIPCTLIRNKGAENNHTKITITVEDSE